MNGDVAEVVVVFVVEEEVKDVAGTEAETEDQVTISIHYLVHIVI